MARPFAICLGLALFAAPASPAVEPVTDANIVTAIDISDSVGGADLRLQIAGMARALRAPEILAAIRGGEAGRIGFAMFAWHHRQYQVVPWTLIASAEDAEAVARAIEARLGVDPEAEARAGSAFYFGRLTDLSRAIDHGLDLLETAPFRARRAVVNVVGNGEDNMGEDAGAARDRLVGLGATVNAVVLDAAPPMLDYYGAQVIGGPGAFLMSADSSGALVGLMRRKFVQDLVAAAPPQPGASTVARN